jgi:predicted  nucleic acid-binding Zn-ribbon protein
MADEHCLLALQRLDTRADALRARRDGLSERSALVACEAEIATLVGEGEALALRRIALRREERRVDELVADLGAKARDVEGTLYSGRVTDTRELQALQTELRAFERRRGEQEEAELAVMEEEEELDGRVAGLDARRESLDRQAAALRRTIEAEESQIDGELSGIAAQRLDLASQLSPEVRGVYEKLRTVSRLAGRVAVPLEGDDCGGCRMTLPTALVSRLRRDPGDGTPRCPHCGRILVP